MRKIFGFILISIGSSVLVGCGESGMSMQQHDQTARINSSVTTKYVKYSNPNEEYINRISKRIILVSSQPMANYHFRMQSSSDPSIELDPDNETITISRGVLDQINDEAQLAAVLTLSIAKMSSHASGNQIVTVLYRAGYDPQALIDLMQKYLDAKNIQMSWLGRIYPGQISHESIATLQETVNTMPKGLLRGADSYQKQING